MLNWPSIEHILVSDMKGSLYLSISRGCLVNKPLKKTSPTWKASQQDAQNVTGPQAQRAALF